MRNFSHLLLQLTTTSLSSHLQTCLCLLYLYFWSTQLTATKLDFIKSGFSFSLSFLVYSLQDFSTCCDQNSSSISGCTLFSNKACSFLPRSCLAHFCTCLSSHCSYQPQGLPLKVPCLTGSPLCACSCPHLKGSGVLLQVPDILRVKGIAFWQCCPPLHPPPNSNCWLRPGLMGHLGFIASHLLYFYMNTAFIYFCYILVTDYFTNIITFKP